MGRIQSPRYATFVEKQAGTGATGAVSVELKQLITASGCWYPVRDHTVLTGNC